MIEKALSAVWPCASVAVTVKLYVVSCVAPDSVPVIVALVAALFNVRPPGKEPDVTAKDVASVAVIVIVPTFSPASKLPRLPAAVCQAGASETVNKAVPDRTARPSLFSTRRKYVPSTGKVNVATIVVALVKETESADTMAPVEELVASTKGVLI